MGEQGTSLGVPVNDKHLGSGVVVDERVAWRAVLPAGGESAVGNKVVQAGPEVAAGGLAKGFELLLLGVTDAAPQTQGAGTSPLGSDMKINAGHRQAGAAGCTWGHHRHCWWLVALLTGAGVGGPLGDEGTLLAWLVTGNLMRKCYPLPG